MAVQVTGSNRPAVTGDDPLGGDEETRATAYSTYLAYFGTYEVQGENVVHLIDGSLFQKWSGEKQVRLFTIEFDQLVLCTQPMTLADGTTVVNELAWKRDKR
jgi:Lipocalin-like domain